MGVAICGPWVFDRKQARNPLFLKKKKQKDFCSFGAERPSLSASNVKGFLVLFFKKEPLTFSAPATP
jgi:hypothetical protein